MPHCSVMSMDTPPFFFFQNWSSHVINIQWQSLYENLLSLLFQGNYLKLNASHRKFDGNIVLVLWKTDYTNPKQALDSYLKK